MGAGLVDYLVADDYVLPKADHEFYTEEVVFMPGPFLPPGELPSFSRRLTRKVAGLPAKGFVFCAFHAAYKLEPEIFSAWMRIL